MIIESQFKPAWWLSNAHAQTIYASMRHPVQAPVDKVEKIDLPDGDFLDLAWSTANLPDDSPLIVILHGLGGCVNSSYVARFMNAFNQQGWRAVLMHFRGAGKEINRLPRAYHSGDTGDLDFLMKTLTIREPHTKKAVVGVSLGGNVLLKWLGEQRIQSKIQTAVAVSVPFQLNKVADKMNIGFSRLYQTHLLNQFKSVFARKVNHLKNPPEVLKRAADCTCFWTFDDKVTAPLYGFNNAHAYYRQSSSRQYLRHISTPTLVIHAEDDPFMTVDVLPTEDELSEVVTLEVSKKGGHVGFISGMKIWEPVYWLDQRIPEYIAKQFNV
ncbi:hydrolase [Legionella quateirensis]|uniref:Alpha/beta hydrolase n=1 Tax=Legionella quateirensis TaxID=45072 RepID=A0A378KRR5_9GAMM|nr:hydrolase [Legionella quateirensis]KTD43737.1 alpha/beta hydrolase [Legionella quateirensis]STY17273.1 hydrolase of the alpha/beta-hydrolase fold family [Legionella quateirensis]